jgi:hypothetical protein
MKTRSIIFVAMILLFSSCLVKSLHPFYTKESVAFDANLVGTWKGKRGSTWSIENIKDKILRENNVNSIAELDESDQKMYEKHKDAYFVSITGDDEDAFFLVVPFKIENQLFLDFSPFFVDLKINSLTQTHLIGSHSLVKLDILDNEKVSLKWFDEDRIKELFQQNKIKIKHEKIRNSFFDEEILLTAQPKELQKFIKKYMASNKENKWRTDTKHTLTRDRTKP